jgi:hypothetical protein
MNNPTLRTLSRLLAPWRTIRRLDEENLKLSQALGDSVVELLTLLQCVRELRQEDERLRTDLATAREAVRRMVRWSYEGYDIGVVQGIWLWATRDGMAGPLPPLPQWLVEREAKASPEEQH